MTKVKKPLRGKKHVFGSLDEMMDYYDGRLTREGGDDWIVLPAGNVVHVMKFGVVGEGIEAKYGVALLDNFKQFILWTL